MELRRSPCRPAILPQPSTKKLPRTFCTADISVAAPWLEKGDGPRSGIASATAPDIAPLIIMDRHIDKACDRMLVAREGVIIGGKGGSDYFSVIDRRVKETEAGTEYTSVVIPKSRHICVMRWFTGSPPLHAQGSWQDSGENCHPYNQVWEGVGK